MRSVLAIAAALSFLVVCAPVFAVTDDAVVRLSSSHSAFCATGFFINGGHTVVTNAHVAEHLCPAEHCDDLRIERYQKDAFVSVTSAPISIVVARQYPAIDVAELTMPDGFTSDAALTLSASAITSGVPLTMIGFPRCGPLRKAAGTSTSLDAVAFSTGASGASGSSGSPIVDSSGAVIGVAFESDSLLWAINDKLFGGTFGLRATRADRVRTLQSSEGMSFTEQANLLLSFYSKDLRGASGLSRISKAFFFINRLSALATEISARSDNPAMLRIAARADTFPGVLLNELKNGSDSNEEAAFTRAVFASGLESRGPFASFVEPIGKEFVERVLTGKQKTPQEIAAFVELLPDTQTRYIPGVLPFVAVVSVVVLVALVIIVGFFGASLGFVFATAHGALGRRLLVTSIVALCVWPLSFLIFLMRSKR